MHNEIDHKANPLCRDSSIVKNRNRELVFLHCLHCVDIKDTLLLANLHPQLIIKELPLGRHRVEKTSHE